MAEENDYGLSAQELADFKSAKNLYSRFGLGSEEDRAAQFEEQKSMTRANILFDLAQAGLIIAATPPTKGESPAATLARAAASSEFFPKVGARSAELQKTKTAMDAQQRQMDMMAVQRMQQLDDLRDTRAYELDLAKAKKKAKDPIIKTLYTITENGVQPKIFDINDPADLALFQAYAKEKNVFDEKTVTPYINSLTAESKLYRIVGDHQLGSGVSYKNNQLINLTDLMKNQLSAANITVIPSELKAEDITTLYKVTKDENFKFSKPERIDISTILYDKDKKKLEADGWGLDSTPYDNALELEKQYQLKLIEKNLDPTTFVLTKEQADGEFDIQVIPTFGNFSQAMTKAEKLIADGYSYQDPAYEQWAALNLREKELDVEIKKKGLPSKSFRLTEAVTSEGTLFPAGTIMQLTDVQQNSEEFKGKIVPSEGAVEIIEFYKDGELFEKVINSPENRAKIEELLNDPKVTANDAEFRSTLDLKTFKIKQGITLDNAKILAEHGNDLINGRPIYRVQDNRVIKIDPKAKTVTVEKELEPTSNVGSLPRDIFNKLDDTQKGAFVESLFSKEIFDTKIVSDTLYLFRKDGKAFKGPDGEMIEYQAIVEGTGADKDLKLYQDSSDPGKFYNSYDGGKTYVYDYKNPDTGLVTRLSAPMPTNVTPVSPLTATEIVSEGVRKSKALQAFQKTSKFMTDYLDTLNIRSLEDLNKYGEIITAAELEDLRMTEDELALAKEVLLNDLVGVKGKNPYIEAANKGTGIWGGFFAALNQLGGATPFTDELFEDVAAARQSLRGLVLLGRAALILSPRFPVYELQKVEAVFPNPNPFTAANAKTEANKLVMLKEMLETQLETNLENLTLSYSDKTIISDIEKNNIQIRNLLHKLRGIDTTNTNLVNKDDERDYNEIVNRANQKIVPTE
jgi:hypothetical protein